jgi:hypothetical protein
MSQFNYKFYNAVNDITKAQTDGELIACAKKLKKVVDDNNIAEYLENHPNSEETRAELVGKVNNARNFNPNEEELAQLVEDSINDMGFKNKKFCEKMGRAHRTLQQNFTRLCLAWFQYNADTFNDQDGRNQATKDISKLFKDTVEAKGSSLYVPYI